MRVHLTTLGCRLNEAEVQTWARALADAGHRLAESPEDADVVVLNTCAVTREAAASSRKLGRRLHRANPGAKLVLTGCWATLKPGRAAELEGVDLVIGNRDKASLVAELGRLDIARPAAAEPERPPRRRTRAFVKVQDGCRNRCTFCVVTMARGKERSRPIDEVVAEVRALRREGAPEIVLAGVHLGGYGSDLGASLRDLVAALLAETDVPRLRLGSLEPWDLPPDFFELWRDPRLLPHLHLPLQSGSDPVLERMARRCSTAAYRELVAGARAAIPDVVITTDLIVGFPGETEAEFDDTCAFVRALGFAHVHTFTWSPREGTAATRLGGRVPKSVQRRRSAVVRDLASRSRQDVLARFVGTERPVLWELRAEPLPGGGTRAFGYTDNYLRVEATLPPGVDLGGEVTPTELRAIAGGERLVGVPRAG